MEKTYSKAKLYGTIFSLGLAGGSIYIIPYIKFVFYDLQLEVTGMNNTQSAMLMSVYTMLGMVIGVPLGVVVDRLNLKDGIKWALIGTTLVTVAYAFIFTSYISSMLIWCALCVFTSIYWPGFSKILNIVGQKAVGGKSGMTFGFYYMCNGISGAVINSISLWASNQFDNPIAAFRAPVIVAAASTLIAAICVQFMMDSDLVNEAEALRKAEAVEAAGQPKEKFSIGKYINVLKIPATWLMIIVCLVGYSLYTLQGYFTPYLTNVVGISASESGIFAIIRTYVFFALAPLGGILSDKVFGSTSRWMAFAFGLMAVIVAGFFMIPAGANPMMVGFYTLLPSAFVQMTYTIKYATINETGISNELTGTVTALAATIAGLAEIAISPFIAWCLDTKGNAGYDILFITLIVILVMGSVCAFILDKKNRARNKKAA